MADKRISIFQNQYKLIEEALKKDADKARVFRAILRYAFDGIETPLSGACKAIFDVVKSCMDAAGKNSERISRYRTKSNASGNVSGNVTSNVTRNVSGNVTATRNNYSYSLSYNNNSFSNIEREYIRESIELYPRVAYPVEAEKSLCRRIIEDAADNNVTTVEAAKAILDATKRFREFCDTYGAKRFVPDACKFYSAGTYKATDKSWRVSFLSKQESAGAIVKDVVSSVDREPTDEELAADTELMHKWERGEI